MFSLIFPLFSRFAGGAADNMRTVLHRAKWQIICSAAVGTAVLFAVFFICLMLFFILADFMPPAQAAGVLALLWLLIAFIGFICLRIAADNRERRRQAQLKQERQKMLAETALAALPILPSLLAQGKQSYKKLGLSAALAVAAAAVYGFLRKDSGADGDKGDEEKAPKA